MLPSNFPHLKAEAGMPIAAEDLCFCPLFDVGTLSYLKSAEIGLHLFRLQVSVGLSLTKLKGYKIFSCLCMNDGINSTHENSPNVLHF